MTQILNTSNLKLIVDKALKQKYMDVERSKDRKKVTNEIFTPAVLVIHSFECLLEGDEHCFEQGRFFIDPTCGNGQFLVAVKAVKMFLLKKTTNLSKKQREESALADIGGVDILRDNVTACTKRLGGGNIILGNALTPGKRLVGQYESEQAQMVEWFNTHPEPHSLQVLIDKTNKKK